MAGTLKIWQLTLALLIVLPCDNGSGGSITRWDLGDTSDPVLVVDPNEVSVVGKSVLYQGTPFTGQIRRYFNDGNVKSKINYLNGMKEGEAQKFFADGVVAERRYYHNNKKSGTHMGWWPSGTVKFRISYLNGLYNGKYEVWFKTGARFKLFHYDSGQEEGSQQMWKEDGTLRANFHVKDGRRFGLIGLKQCKSVENVF